METALRRLYGAHLTPSQIVRQYILPHVRGRLWKHLWVDLFCGEGSLIFPLVEAIEPSKRTEFFANHVLMFDVQRAQVERVVQRALDLGVSRDVATKRVVVRDTLKDYPSEIRREQSV